MEKERLSKRLKVSFNKSDLVKLQSQFLKSGEKTFSGFCRKRLTEKFYFPDLEEFEKVNSKLTTAGGKINQITKALNAGTASSEIDFSPLKELSQVLKDIDKLKENFLNQVTRNPGRPG